MAKKVAEVEEPKEVKPEPKEDEVVIDVSKKPDEDDRPEEGPEEKVDRQAKRSARYDKLLRENQESARMAAERAERAEQSLQAMRLEMAKLHGRVEATATPKADPYDEKLSKNWKDRQALYDSVKNRQNVSPAEMNEAMERMRALEREHTELVTERVVERRFREQQQKAPNQREEYIKMQYSDVFNSQTATAHFKSHFYAQQARGVPATEALIIESAEYARKMISPSRPGVAERARLAGSPAVAAETGNSDDIVKLGERQRALADNVFASIKNPDERYRKWAEKFSKVRKAKAV